MQNKNKSNTTKTEQKALEEALSQLNSIILSDLYTCVMAQITEQFKVNAMDKQYMTISKTIQNQNDVIRNKIGQAELWIKAVIEDNK